jgi:hypothetical protein
MNVLYSQEATTSTVGDSDNNNSGVVPFVELNDPNEPLKDLLPKAQTAPSESAASHLLSESEDDGHGFKLEWIPIEFRPIIKATCKQARVPEWVASMMLYNVLSMTVGKGVGIDNKERGFKTLGCIQSIIGMPSGSGKSITGKILTKPFNDCVFNAQSKFRSEVRPKYKRELSKLQKEITETTEQLEINDSPILIDRLNKFEGRQCELESLIETVPIFIMDDATEAAIEEGLQKNNGTISIMTLDGRRVVDNILGRSTFGKGKTADSPFLVGFSQDTLRTHRVGDREADVKAPYLSSCIIVQDDKLYKILDHTELRDSGFLARQLILCYDQRQPKTGGIPTAVPQEITDEYGLRITNLFNAFRVNDEARSRDETEWISLTKEQSERLWEYEKEVDDKVVNGERNYLSSSADRLAEQAVKIALLSHVASIGKDAPSMLLKDEVLENAIQMTEWLYQHLEGLMEYKINEVHNEVIQKAISIAKKSIEGIVKPNDLHSRHLVSSAEEAKRILDEAPDYFVRKERKRIDGRGGKSSVVYVLKQ